MTPQASPTPLTWTPRWPPLEPLYVVARGAAARALATRLLAEPHALRALRGLVSADLLAVTGTSLPWVDGAEYFGRDGAAALLLVPTTRAPSVPTAWLERRFRAIHAGADWPCLYLDGALLPVGRAAELDPAKLEAWLEQQRPIPESA